MRSLWGRPPNVEKLARRGNVKGLVRALRYEDPVTDTSGRTVDLGADVRAGAAEVLGHIDAPESSYALTLALEDPDERVRVAAVRALRERGGTAVVKPLMRSVAHWTDPAHSDSRDQAVDALASAHHPDVLRDTVAALLERDDELAEADAGVVRRLAEATGAPAALRDTIEDLIGGLDDAAHVARARTLLVWLAPDSVDPLIDAVREGRSLPESVRALGATRDARAVVPLSALVVSDEPPPVRAAAAWGLGEVRDPSAVGALLAATSDAEYVVRAEATAGFDKLGNAGIAVAMTMLIQPMLENGAAAQDAVDAGRPEELAAEVEVAEPEPATEALPAATGPAPAAPPVPYRRPEPLVDRARPVLRRLLGR